MGSLGKPVKQLRRRCCHVGTLGLAGASPPRVGLCAPGSWPAEWKGGRMLAHEAMFRKAPTNVGGFPKLRATNIDPNIGGLLVGTVTTKAFSS